LKDADIGHFTFHALRQYKNPPIPTKQEQIVVPNNSVLVLVKAS